MEYTGQVKIDDVHDVLDVQSTGGDTGRDKNRASGSAESTSKTVLAKRIQLQLSINLQGIFTLALRAIRMD